MPARAMTVDCLSRAIRSRVPSRAISELSAPFGVYRPRALVLHLWLDHESQWVSSQLQVEVALCVLFLCLQLPGSVVQPPDWHAAGELGRPYVAYVRVPRLSRLGSPMCTDTICKDNGRYSPPFGRLLDLSFNRLGGSIPDSLLTGMVQLQYVE